MQAASPSLEREGDAANAVSYARPILWIKENISE